MAGEDDQPVFRPPRTRKLHDPDVSFEEYYYYAKQTREEEKGLSKPKTVWRELLFNAKKSAHNVTHHGSNSDVGEAFSAGDEKRGSVPHVNLADSSARLEISDQEWTDASRAFRSASAGACFYLITTDILGPYGVGFALGTLGWGPGIVLYTVFGFLAGYSGYLLYHSFLGLDSYQFPLRNYGDLAFRVYGTGVRHLLNVVQALALLLILGQVTIQNGQALSEVSKFRLCYAVCPVLFVIAGFALGQIRTLRNYGWVANLAIWLNLLVIFISMGVIANSPPNYAISTLGSAGGQVDTATITPNKEGVYPPIIHYNGLPVDGLIGSINGLLSGVLAYSGAQLFVEFMAEMRRPNDFIKAMWGAQAFIYVVYLAYGSFVYYFQGQYSFSVSYQGISPYGWQTACNMIGLISGLIAAGLYGNIGIKVLYNNVLMDIFGVPPLISRGGKIIWAILVPIWWTIAWVISAAIPDYIGFVSIISSLCLLNLTYTFPPILALGYDIRKNAMLAFGGEQPFNPQSGQVVRGARGINYWIKGFFSGGILQVLLNVWHVLYFLGSLAMSGLGMYAAIEGMILAFQIPQFNSFSCVSPLNLNAQQG